MGYNFMSYILKYAKHERKDWTLLTLPVTLKSESIKF